MTSKQDNFQGRVSKLGEGLERTLGVPQDGGVDPTGEYPKREYNFGSSINQAARGTKINELYIGGGDIGLSLDLAPKYKKLRVVMSLRWMILRGVNVFLSDTVKVRG